MKLSINRFISLFLALAMLCSALSLTVFAGETVNTIGCVTQDNDIILYGASLADDTYTLKYECEEAALAEYANICSLTISGGADATYTGLIAENRAPVDADAIGVYDSQGHRVGSIPLATLSAANPGEKLYSFAAISDVHIGRGGTNSIQHFTAATEYFEANEDIAFVALCGDAVDNAVNVSQLEAYQSIVADLQKPIYLAAGNHEGVNLDNAEKSYDDVKTYFKQNAYPNINQELFYSFEQGNDVFIMVGVYGNYNHDRTFSDAELQWLYEILEANKDKRCFLFHHYFNQDGSGDAVDCYTENDGLRGYKGEVFYSLLSHYSNVIHFHGHSHEEFAIQEMNAMNNYDNLLGSHSVHIPSLGYPKKVSGSSLVSNFAGSEGYIVDVYENAIILRGRDFANEKFLPIATYQLDTTPKNVEDDSYSDPTGTIVNKNSNVLKAGSGWYNSAVAKNTITKISFVESYAGAYEELWDASISENYKVAVYRNGTELYIVGSNGVIANSDSREMFKGFTALEEISGLEHLNTSHVTMALSMFEDCTSLKKLDLSGWDLANVSGQYSGASRMFFNCTSLKEVRLAENLCKNYIYTSYFTAMFQGCASLEQIDLSFLSGKNVGLVSFLKDCFSLTDVTFADCTIWATTSLFDSCRALLTVDLSDATILASSMQNTFRNCTSLHTVILPEAFDTTVVTDMRGMFMNCASLVLDCSTWETPADLTDFNLGAPGVIEPYHFSASLPGDFTTDSQVNNEDVIYLLWHTMFPKDYPLTSSGDFTRDGQVNNEDVIHLLWHTMFPDDYPL